MENTTGISTNVQTVSASINLLPIGTIMPFAGNATQATELNSHGWYLCNGALLQSKQYPRLFTVLKNTCGGVAPEFKLPDLRGVFLRAVDVQTGEQGTSRDPDAAKRTSHTSADVVGNQVLSRQVDNFRNHKHLIPDGSEFVKVEVAGRGDSVWFERFEKPRDGQPLLETAALGGDETRPVNVSVNYIIFAGLPA
jgi:hypothetical protein